jgi:hypothetical protein
MYLEFDLNLFFLPSSYDLVSPSFSVRLQSDLAHPRIAPFVSSPGLVSRSELGLMVMVPEQTSLEVVEVVEWLKEVGFLVSKNVCSFYKFCHCLSRLGNSSHLIFFEQLLALSIVLSLDPVGRSPDQV